MQLKLKLYGPFSAELGDGAPVPVRGDKQIALLALLATSPDGTRSRRWLQEKLWGRSGADLGRASLRQAVSHLKQVLGTHFDTIFQVNRDQIALRPRSFSLVGHPGEGQFLQDVDIREDAFETWLCAYRAGQQTELNGNDLQQQSLLPSILITCPQISGAIEHGAAIGDALTHEVARALSRSQLFFVISHLTSRRIDPQTIEMSYLRDQLHASYVVASTLRSHTSELVLDLDLIETRTGRILWTRQFAAGAPNFAQDAQEFIAKISSQIGKTILARSIEISGTSDLPNVESHALMMTALILMNHMSQANFAKARQMLEELVRRKPRKAELEAWLAQWYLLNVSQGWSSNPTQDKALAMDWSNRALDVNPMNPTALIIQANIQNLLFSEFDAARAGFRNALDIDPNNAFGWLVKSMLDAFTDNGHTAVNSARQANSLSPLDPREDFFLSLTATAHLADENYEMALDFADKSLQKNKNHPSTQRVRIIALERLGRHEDAQGAVTSLLQLAPEFTVDQYLRFHPAAKFQTGQNWANALKSAGAPIN